MKHLSASQWFVFFAAAMSLVAFFDWPYGYFVLLRLVVSAAFIIVALHAHRRQRSALVAACALGLLLFQPVVKVQFDRGVWFVVDLLAGALLIYGNLIGRSR